MAIVRTWLHAPAEPLLGCSGHPNVCPILTSQMLSLQSCGVVGNNSIGNNAAFSFVEKFKSLMNINEWIAHVQVKQLRTPNLH